MMKPEFEFREKEIVSGFASLSYSDREQARLIQENSQYNAMQVPLPSDEELVSQGYAVSQKSAVYELPSVTNTVNIQDVIRPKETVTIPRINL